MNEIDRTYLELQASFQLWSERMDEFVTRVGSDDTLWDLIDELRLKQRLGRSALEALRMGGGRKWETTKVVVKQARNFWETSMHFLSGAAKPVPGVARVLAHATMRSREGISHEPHPPSAR